MLYWLVIIAKSVMDGIAYPLYVGMINMQHLLGITVVHEKHHLTPTVEFYGSWLLLCIFLYFGRIKN